MSDYKKTLKKYLDRGVSSEHEEMIRMEIRLIEKQKQAIEKDFLKKQNHDIYFPGDSVVLQNFSLPPEHQLLSQNLNIVS